MKRFRILSVFATMSCAFWLAGCHSQPDHAAEAPPSAQVLHVDDGSIVHVDRAHSFPLVDAVAVQGDAHLSVTGTVTPDVSATVPVVSLASGRVVDIHARVGDHVNKGQLLMEVQSTDVSGAFSQYLKAENDERLARAQFERAQLLFDKGAISKGQFEIADNGEQDARASLTASEEQLKVLGVDKAHPSDVVKVRAPVAGIVIAQNVTTGAVAGVTYSGSSTAFTIANLAHVWIICDVFENDLGAVRVGQDAEIRLNAYPDRTFHGKVSDIGAVLDPSLRTAKVRVQVENPNGLMRVGMFATAELRSPQKRMSAAVPASAVLHLHDRDWVYVATATPGEFRREEVKAGRMLSGGLQEIEGGLQAGEHVASTALALEQASEQ